MTQISTMTPLSALPQSGALVPVAVEGDLTPYNFDLGAALAPEGITPESQGALGDGLTNDTAAFQKLATVIQSANGGVISLRPGATYIVGAQTFLNSGIYMWKGQTVLSFNGLTKPLIIHGNGAKLKLASGLKFGTFDSSGNPTNHTPPWTTGEACTTAIDGIVSVQNCTAAVLIEDLEIDGNASNLSWGGQFGNQGWQLPADLFFIWGNLGPVTMRRCYAHHGSRDGLDSSFGSGTNAASGYGDRVHIQDCTFEYNNRNNWSSGNGNGCLIENTRFNHAGKCPGVPSPTFSSPGANIDLEAFVPASQMRNFRFKSCEFVDAAGNSMNADGGDIQKVSFENCRFVGTSGWSMWVVKPWMRWRDCTIVGGMEINAVRAVGDYSTGDASAPVFENCNFTDDTTQSPTGTIYTGAIVASGGSDLGFTRFRKCSFNGSTNVALFSANGGYYEDCQFTIGSLGLNCSNPNFIGHTVITSATTIDLIFSGIGRWSSDITYGIVTTGNTHSNTTLDSLASASGIVVGQTVTGTGIPSGTTVSAISGTTVTLSQAATATATGVSITFSAQRRRGTATWDPPSIAAGARATTTVSVPWAKLRDIPKATASLSVQGLTLGAYVSTAASHTNDAGVVTVTLDNFTGGTVDLASLTVDVAVRDRELV